MTRDLASFRGANEGEILRMGRDHSTWGDWTIMTDGYRVWVSKQKMGEARTHHIEVPKGVFDRLVDAYTKPRKLHPRKSR